MTPSRPAIGALTGLASEARILKALAGELDLDLQVKCGAARPAQAEEQARALAEDGPQGLISFGLAGALSPNLSPGDLVLGTEVIDPSGDRKVIDEAWGTQLQNAARNQGLALTAGALLGSDRIIATRADKATLFGQSGALAVDMESHHLAAAAQAKGIPFLVVRAIADPADFDFPVSALAPLTPDGRARPWAVAGRLLKRPGDLPGLMALAGHSAKAHKALRELAGVAATLFGRV